MVQQSTICSTENVDLPMDEQGGISVKRKRGRNSQIYGWVFTSSLKLIYWGKRSMNAEVREQGRKGIETLA